MLAVVTGASSGIGLMYARELARRGHDRLIVSNQEKEIVETAEAIHKEYGVGCTPLYRDLAADGAAEELFAYCEEKRMEIEILVNNAGVFFFNPLTETSVGRIDLMLKLHVITVTHMTRLFGGAMAKRGHGYILNMSSMSAWMAMPGISIYNSTKSYILNMSRSLWYEFMPKGVSVTAVCPGAVDTGLYGLSPYWRRVAVRLGISMPPEKLAKRGLDAMFRRKKQAVPGWINRWLFIPLIKHLPDWTVFTVMKRLKQFQK